MDWIAWLDNHRNLLGWMVFFSVATLVGSAIALPLLIVRIPVDYFTNGKYHALPWEDRHPVIRITLLAFKNLVGAILVLAGIAMLVLPGQGILTIVAGLALLDFPGRHRLLQRLVCQPQVLRSINWIRARAGQPPLGGPRSLVIESDPELEVIKKD